MGKILRGLSVNKKVSIAAAMMFLASSFQESNGRDIGSLEPLALTNAIEGVIDRFYGSSNKYYIGVSQRLYECAIIYKNINTENTPRKVTRDRDGFHDALVKSSMILFGDDKKWQAQVSETAKQKVTRLGDTPKAIRLIVHNCNMYLDILRINDAVFETENPSLSFED